MADLNQPHQARHSFASSADATRARQQELMSLIEGRRTNDKAYFAKLRAEKVPLYGDDLQLVLPRERLPQPQDGEFQHRRTEEEKRFYPAGLDIQTRYSRSSTLSEKLLRLIEDIEARDPEFMKRYCETALDLNQLNLALMLNVLNVRPDLQDQAMQSLKNEDSFFFYMHEMMRDYPQSGSYIYDHKINNLIGNIAGRYVRELITAAEEQNGKSKLEAFEPILEFSANYQLDQETLELLLQKMPIPNSMFELHRDGMRNLQLNAEGDVGACLWFAEHRQNFAQLGMDAKQRAAEYLLEMFADAYKISPPPKLVINPELKSIASHSGAETQEECFRNPLGVISINPNKSLDDFDELVSALGHEFTHALEDVSLLVMSTEFQQWYKASAAEHGVSIDNDSLPLLRKAALPLSFNTAATDLGIFGKPEQALYRQGRYIAAEGSDEDRQDQNKNKGHYQQLRERHAYSIQNWFMETLRDTLNHLERYKDPIHAVIDGQLGMFDVEKLLRDKILPKAQGDEFKDMRLLMESAHRHFKAADARETSMTHRLVHFHFGYANAYSAIISALSEGLIDGKDNANWAIKGRVEELRGGMRQAYLLYKHMNNLPDVTQTNAANASTSTAASAGTAPVLQQS